MAKVWQISTDATGEFGGQTDIAFGTTTEGNPAIRIGGYIFDGSSATGGGTGGGGGGSQEPGGNPSGDFLHTVRLTKTKDSQNQDGLILYARLKTAEPIDSWYTMFTMSNVLAGSTIIKEADMSSYTLTMVQNFLDGTSRLICSGNGEGPYYFGSFTYSFINDSVTEV